MGREMKEASEVGKGDIVLVNGEPCRIKGVSSSMPGKHGHAKYSFEAVGVFDGKKRNFTESSEARVEVPLVERSDAQVLSESEDSAQLMDLSSYETFEITLPEELRGEVGEGDEVEYVQAMGRRKIESKKE